MVLECALHLRSSWFTLPGHCCFAKDAGVSTLWASALYFLQFFHPYFSSHSVSRKRICTFLSANFFDDVVDVITAESTEVGNLAAATCLDEGSGVLH